MTRWFLGMLSGALLAATIGCQGTPTAAPPSPTLLSPSAGQVELSIRWPYRAQFIPTSTQRLVIQIQGPTSQRMVVDRPLGETPLSVALLEVTSGEGYQIAVEAYDGSGSMVPIATGQSDPFIALPNKRQRVTVSLQATYVPAIASVTPDHGAPGTLVTVTGANFGMDRSLWPSISFGGLPAPGGVSAGPEALMVRVPAGARTGAVGATVDGVSTAGGTVTFTVLSALGIEPASVTLAPGAAHAFTARATSDLGVPFGSPAVEWSLMPMPDPAYVDPDPEGEPSGTAYLPALGSLDAQGRFVTSGATGSQWLQIVSGSLTATAAITVAL